MPSSNLFNRYLPSQLIREQEPDAGPVAIYHKNRRRLFLLGSSRRPYLEVQPSAKETLDSLIGKFYRVTASHIFPHLLKRTNDQCLSCLWNRDGVQKVSKSSLSSPTRSDSDFIGFLFYVYHGFYSVLTCTNQIYSAAGLLSLQN